MTGKKPPTRARDQGAPQAENRPQDGPGRPQDAAAPAAQASTPPQADRAQDAPRPRNYKPETRTFAQAAAQGAPDTVPWPWPAPVHGITGFSQLAGWKQQEALGGEYSAHEHIGEEPNALLILITQCETLVSGEVEQEALIATHDKLGKFYLRCTRHSTDGFLIGVIDEKGRVYGAPEWYATKPDAKEGWKEWADACHK